MSVSGHRVHGPDHRADSSVKMALVADAERFGHRSRGVWRQRGGERAQMAPGVVIEAKTGGF